MLLALELLEKLTAYRNRNGKSDNMPNHILNMQ